MWKSMESAPTDGTCFLVSVYYAKSSDVQTVFIGRYNSIAKRWVIEGLPMWKGNFEAWKPLPRAYSTTTLPLDRQ